MLIDIPYMEPHVSHMGIILSPSRAVPWSQPTVEEFRSPARPGDFDLRGGLVRGPPLVIERSELELVGG